MLELGLATSSSDHPYVFQQVENFVFQRALFFIIQEWNCLYIQTIF